MSVARHHAGARLRPRISARLAVLIALVVAILIPASFSVRSLLAMRARTADLQHQVQVLEAQKQRLEQRIERAKDPDYLERMARECLGMVRPGEVPFAIVTKGGQQPRPASC